MTDEVRYNMLRPGQIVERRKACPAAYIPIGNLEWHGVHNPVGADTLQCEGLAIMAAEAGGGVAFPPLYYGESRSEALMEANSGGRDEIAAGYGLPPENFDPHRFVFTPTEQATNYQKLLLHVLAEVETLGFKVGVLVAGHYPLIDHCRAAVLLHNQRQKQWRAGMLAWACVDYLLVKDKYPHSGDHAGKWETSNLLALHPGAVDQSLLPPAGEKLVGVGGSPPQEATAELGREHLEYAAGIVVSEVRHRLENPGMYAGHGNSLKEGLWRE